MSFLADRIARTRSLLATGLCVALGAGCLAAVPARAQHVVTEEEAGKLTLEALTAAPVYHPTYRAYVRPAMATRFVRRGERARAPIVRASLRTAMRGERAHRHHR